MPQELKLDATITTTFERVYDFARMLCKTWSPAFYLSIVRDGKKEFSDQRFDRWLDNNKKKINWNILYPEDVCNARLQSGKNKGMRCSRKQKLLSRIVKDDTGEEREELEDTGFCGVHKNTKERWNSRGFSNPDDKEKYVYGGEPPLCRKGFRAADMLKRNIKIPRSFLDDGSGPTEEDLMTIIKKMSSSLNKLMNKSVTYDNQFKSVRGTLNRIMTNEQKYIEKNIISGKINDINLNNGAYDRDYLDKVDFDIEVNSYPPILFEDIATQEQLDLKKKFEDEKIQKAKDKILDCSKGDQEAEEREKELKKRMEAFFGLDSEGKPLIKGVSEPTREEVADSVQRSHLSNHGFVYEVKRNDRDRAIDVSGVGSIKSEGPQNIYTNKINGSIKQHRYVEQDFDFKKDNMKLWKKGLAFCPFYDPSIDPLQQDIKEVIVKVEEDGEEFTWIKYYAKLAKRIRVLNKILEKDNIHDEIKSNREVIIRKMESVMNIYGARPTNKVQLLLAMKEIDFASIVIKETIEFYNFNR